MCGFIFAIRKNPSLFSDEQFSSALESIKWRGPDSAKILLEQNGSVIMGHNRLAVQGGLEDSIQPMQSRCGRYSIVFNGEIYNHLDIRANLKLDCRTSSDTETILEGYATIGERIVDKLEGIFAFVIFDNQNKTWFATRDRFGVKPLYQYSSLECLIFSSEVSAIRCLVQLSVDYRSVDEWKWGRRPLIGKTFSREVSEFPPASSQLSDSKIYRYWKLEKKHEIFKDEEFFALVSKAADVNRLSDYDNVSLLSGGLDSGVLAALLQPKMAYTVGLSDQNEFIEARQTANAIGIELKEILLGDEKGSLEQIWRRLILMKQEPLLVPNEGLIFGVCASMGKNEKVVYTGEGADEIMFGYDQIYRWALEVTTLSSSDFISRYSYSGITDLPERMVNYILELRQDKAPIEFLEDFFFQFHLVTLLRRMDFASMAASKEARVPFLYTPLVEYCYRNSPTVKINASEAKLPLRRYAKKLGIDFVNHRKKIGFSARPSSLENSKQEYQAFQGLNLEILGW